MSKYLDTANVSLFFLFCLLSLLKSTRAVDFVDADAVDTWVN